MSKSWSLRIHDKGVFWRRWSERPKPVLDEEESRSEAEILLADYPSSASAEILTRAYGFEVKSDLAGPYLAHRLQRLYKDTFLKQYPHLTRFEDLLSTFSIISTALRSNPFVSVREIHAIIIGAPVSISLPEDNSITMQFIFSLIGELTMLYTPSLRPTAEFFRISVGDVGSLAQRCRTWQCDTVPSTEATRSIGDLLRCFGGKDGPIPRLKNPDGPGLTEAANSLVTLNLCFYTLDSLAGVTISWTSSWCEHLELDERQKKLKVFKYPSLCLIMATAKETIYDQILKDYYEDTNSNASSMDADTHKGSVLMIELLATYRLIFSQNSQSRRLYRKRARQYLKPFPHDDPLIPRLCGEDWTKEKVYEEFYIGGAKTVYSAMHDFPIFGDRLLALQRFVLVQSPDDWLSLWRDRREPLRFWTLWAVVFFGMFTVILGILQVCLAIAQTIGSFED
ncbi:MAG: hypothetical protein Q9226_008259 [Calogaya cf. arnoldii]